MASNKIQILAAFVFGAGAAFLTTWQTFKKKYERRTREEIDSVKETFEKRYGTCNMRNPDEPKKTREEYEEQAKQYTSYTKNEPAQTAKIIEETAQEKPYLIAAEEFGETDFETLTFTYYADKILTDDDNEPVRDVDSVVGFDSLAELDRAGEDMIYVRNPRLRCDYEILAVEETYLETVGAKPRKFYDDDEDQIE
jgi:hypothetical protein